MVPNGTVAYTWEQIDNGNVGTIANAVDNLDGKIGAILELVTSAGTAEANDAVDGTLWGRCDSVFTPVGCVDEYGPTFVAFDATTNPPIGPVAEHVYLAQRTLPSH